MTTVLLVDDDPLHAYARRSILERHFHHVERAADAAAAFILVEEPLFAEKLGLVVVGLNRPGIGSAAFVEELTSRLPSVPVLVLGRGWEEADLYQGENVRFLPRTVPSNEILAVSRRLTEQYTVRVV
jgi:CheY-like chemotaxis protein